VVHIVKSSFINLENLFHKRKIIVAQVSITCSTKNSAVCTYIKHILSCSLLFLQQCIYFNNYCCGLGKQDHLVFLDSLARLCVLYNVKDVASILEFKKKRYDLVVLQLMQLKCKFAVFLRWRQYLCRFTPCFDCI